jgi:26S proteasome regulatory subunit N1
MTPDNEWLYKNKDHGMMAAAASLGLIQLWNVEEGLAQIDKFLYSSEEYVKAGAALAVGILSSGVRNDADPTVALLDEHINGDSHIMKCAACTGLGIAYAGSAREDVMELLLPVVEQESAGPATMIEVSLAGLALGMIFVGKCDDAAGGAIVQRLMEASDEELDHSHAKFLCIGLGLLFLGKMEKAEAMIEALKTIEHKISKFAAIVLETFAYAGSGNVLRVQEMLHQCSEHLEEDAAHQMAAVIGIGLITMGEPVGAEMALRSFEHLLHYCELPVKRAVPLALGVLNISNPDFSVIDQLSRMSHDPDTEISQNAILVMGLTSAGTNNSRVAGLLRQLSEFYSKEAGHVFCVRIAQAMLHMGKGLMTLSPMHSDRMITSGPALGGVLTLIYSCLDLKSTLLDKTHYLLYYLTCAMNPRMLITVNEDLSWRPVTVRVGQAVDTVGQAGKPKTITGFQTHTTPVLISAKERAELGTEEVLSVSSVLEGIVILKDNPDYETPESSDK